MQLWKAVLYYCYFYNIFTLVKGELSALRQSGQQVSRKASEGLGPREIQFKTPEEEWRAEDDAGEGGGYQRVLQEREKVYALFKGCWNSFLKLGLM